MNAEVWPTIPSTTKTNYFDAHRVYADYKNFPVPESYDPPPASNLGFWRFHQLYPNIYHVEVWVLEKNRDVEVDGTRFINFLRTCSGLNSLIIHFPSFGSDTYYKMASLSALSDLRSLILIERPRKHRERVDLNLFLDRSSRLNHLYTNVATREMMLELVLRRLNEDHFDFYFGFPVPADQTVYTFRFSSCHGVNNSNPYLVVSDKSGSFIFKGYFDIKNPEELNKLKLTQKSSNWFYLA